MNRSVAQASTTKGLLKIYLGSLTFFHHPLFSSEHVLASRLMQCYTSYRQRHDLKISQSLLKKLKILRKSLSKLRQELISTQVFKNIPLGTEVSTSHRLNLYKKELKECRRLVESELEQDRKLTLSILDIWQELKELRLKNGYQTTDVILKIHQLDSKSLKDEQHKWNQNFNQDVEERLSEKQEEADLALKEYKNQLVIWKDQRRKRKEARFRIEQLEERDTSDGPFEEDPYLISQDLILLSTKESEKPVMPQKVTKELIEEEVKEIFEKTRRPPGEPEVDFELLHSSAPTDLGSCPSKEKQRRNSVAKSNFWLKVFINRKLVMQTPSFKLREDFIVSCSIPLVVSLISWPKEIRIDLMQKTSINQIHIASAHLPLPSPIASADDQTTLDNALFTSSKMFSAATGGVGSGLKDSMYGASFIEGRISFSFSWQKNSDGMLLTPNGMAPYATKKEKSSFIHQSDNAIEDSLTLDPNNPRNAELISSLQHSPMDQKSLNNYFDLSGGTRFCSDEEIDANVRLKILRLRAKGVAEFRSLKMVPPSESAFLKATLQNYEENWQMERGEGSQASKEETHWPENPRKKQAERMVSSLLKKYEQKSQEKVTPELQDLVQEEQIPNIGTIGELLTILKPYRPLRPERKKRGQVRGVAMTDKSINLILHIGRGFHVPIREDQSQPEDRRESNGSDDWMNAVRPFVEVSFQRSVVRTSSSYGPNPTWNEQLILPFRAPNGDFSPGSLQTVEDCIYLHLYDEVFYSLLEDEQLRDSTVHHQIERRWLGSLRIPFSTIYLNNKIEGTFPLDSPSLLLGYSNRPHPMNEGSIGSEREASSRSKRRNNIEKESNFFCPHLSIYLTLEPTLSPIEVTKSFFDSLEPEEVISKGHEWVKILMDKFPQRYFTSHVLDLSGKWVALHRFISPLNPPPEIVGNLGKGIPLYRRLAWYVSLMPTLGSLKGLPSAHRLWANAEQFVKLGLGHDEERGVLLTNFLLAMDFEAYLLIGSGIPEGFSCYVLIKYEGAYKIILPSSASVIDVHQSLSPLKAVYILVNQENMYANIQKYVDAPRIHFDTSVSSDWRPFFSKAFPDPGLPTIQPKSLTFHPPDSEFWTDLQEKLRLILRDAIMKWRPMLRTPWNRVSSSSLWKMLRSFEQARLKGKNVSMDNSLLATLFKSHKVCGVCIQQPYNTTAALVEAVYSTGIHACRIPGVEFALAVSVVAYPSDVASVWIYVASLVKRSNLQNI